MGDYKGQRPAAKAFAIVNKHSGVNNGQSIFIELGVGFLTKTGNILFTLHSEPVQWGDPYFERVVLIRMEKSEEERSAAEKPKTAQPGAEQGRPRFVDPDRQTKPEIPKTVDDDSDLPYDDEDLPF